jgi:hypothetical protein
MNTITIAPASKGQVTATSSDGQTFLTTQPLLDGARYWLEKGVPQTLSSRPSGPQARVTGRSEAPSGKQPN